MFTYLKRKAVEASDRARFRQPRTRMPDELGCSDSRDGIHRWQYSTSWNGNRRSVLPFNRDTTGIGRSGWRCYHCGKFHWDERDEVFALKYAYYTGQLPGVKEFITKGTPYTLTNGRTNAPYIEQPTRWGDPEV